MTRYVRLLAYVVIFASVLASLGYTNIANPGFQPRMSPAVTQVSATASSGSYFDHLVVIMMEDEGIDNICGGNPPPCNGSNTPFLSNLANSYGIGQQYLSLISQSWPDYYGILGASIFGCPSNCYPAPGSIVAPNLVDRFGAAGVNWKAYMENQNVAMGCDMGNQAPYEFGHNGFVAFQDITDNPARCDNIVLANPSSCGSLTDCSLINDLNSASAPNFMWLTPNDCNNMHAASGCSNGCTSDGSTTCMVDGDNYLSGLVPNILDSLTFRTERSALFVVFDEGEGYCPLNGSSENCVYDVWAGPVAKTGFSTVTGYSHYSLTKTIEVNWNLPTLTSNDANASAMTEFLQTSTQSANFSMSASPSSLSTKSGSSASSTITLSSLNGFAGTVSLSALSSPTGPSASVNPSTVSLSSGGSGKATLTISTIASTPPGTYTITVTGSSGTLSHSATVSITVSSSSSTGDFSISANPSTITLARGTAKTSSITLTSINGFSGTVTLSVKTSSAKLRTSLSTSSITLTSGGSGSSSLTLSANRKTPVGSYTITVTGTIGSLTHSFSISAQVT